MKYIFIFAMLSLTYTSAYAQWIAISENPDHIAYIRKGTIKKDGDIVQLWEMRNFKTEKYVGLSSKILLKIDCKNNKSQRVEAYLYSDKDGDGNVMQSKKQPGEWENIIPDSIYDSFSEIVCN